MDDYLMSEELEAEEWMDELPAPCCDPPELFPGKFPDL